MIGLSPRAFEATIDARVLAALDEDPEQQLPLEAFCKQVRLAPDDLRASLRRLCLRRTEGPAGSARS